MIFPPDALIPRFRPLPIEGIVTRPFGPGMAVKIGVSPRENPPRLRLPPIQNGPHHRPAEYDRMLFHLFSFAAGRSFKQRLQVT